MNQYIATFLFQYKVCPLPGLGHLLVQVGAAKTDIVNHQLLAPVPAIVFSSTEIASEEFIEYLATKRKESFEASKAALSIHVEAIRKGMPLDQIGQFSSQEEGRLIFHPIAIDPLLLPATQAVRVVHPDTEHAILVGDKESTNTAMTEYYNEELAPKDRWWIGALVVAAIAIGIIWYYCDAEGCNGNFGNGALVLG
ncbi:MAG: hypothetical protein WCJ85_10675 [Chitinophagaceae bacterium]